MAAALIKDSEEPWEAADAEKSIKAVSDLCERVATACRTDPRKTIVE